MPIKQFTKKIEFSEGKRSIVYLGVYKKKKAIAKVVKYPKIHKNLVKNEVNFLKLLNKHKIGPKLYSSGKNYIIMEFIPGKTLTELKDNKYFTSLVKKVLIQCKTLDKLKINKLEFTRPFKHVIINKNKPILIDFERCYKTNNPKNVTQFCHFILKLNLIKINKNDFLTFVKNYKLNNTEENFKKILNSL